MAKAVGSIIASSIILLSVLPYAYGSPSAKITDFSFSAEQYSFLLSSLEQNGVPPNLDLLNKVLPFNLSLPGNLTTPHQHTIVQPKEHAAPNDECSSALVVHDGLNGPYDNTVSKRT